MDTLELTAFLDEHKAEIHGAIKAKIISGMTQRVEWDLPELIRKDVLEFYKDEIAPAVKQHLADNKAALMQVVIKASVDAAEGVAKAMAQVIQHHMADDYKMRKFFGVLFDVPGRY